MKKYSHLTSEQRYTIEVLLRQGKSRKEICETINISQSTLCRELKRNSGQRGYHCKQAQVKANDRKRRLQNYRNLTIGLRKFIRDKITEEQWSPAQIVGYLRKKGRKCVCIETIYTYEPIGLRAVTYGSTAAISSSIENAKCHSHTKLFKTEP